MNRTLAIFKREFAAYFGSPLAYTVTTFFLVLLGLLFFFGGLYQIVGRPFYMPRVVAVDNMFNASQLLFLLLIPALTMRLFAEERRSGTLELLTTLPVRDIEIVMGKYLAAFGYVVFVLLLTLVYPIYVSTLGNLDWGAVTAGYVGLGLVALATLAIGVFASSITQHQVLAFVVAVAITFPFYLLHMVSFQFGVGAGNVLNFLAFRPHFDGIARGVIDTGDMCYFLGVSAIFLFLAHRLLGGRRWR
ncbi:MAG: ABC transporter permease [Deltaproteobacteria bacterium]|nr:ABC transporter permease [Deltaproteobacteria bacterium]